MHGFRKQVYDVENDLTKCIINCINIINGPMWSIYAAWDPWYGAANIPCFVLEFKQLPHPDWWYKHTSWKHRACMTNVYMCTNAYMYKCTQTIVLIQWNVPTNIQHYLSELKEGGWPPGGVGGGVYPLLLSAVADSRLLLLWQLQQHLQFVSWVQPINFIPWQSLRLAFLL